MPEDSPSRYGVCSDCENPVDVVVDIHQLTGANQWLCTACRCERIRKAAKSKAEGQVKAIEEKAAAAQEKQELPGMEE